MSRGSKDVGKFVCTCMSLEYMKSQSKFREVNHYVF